MRKLFFVVAALLLPAVSAFAQYDLFPELPLRIQRAIDDQYRKPTKDELETLKVSAADKERFNAFLRQPETGLTRLAVDQKCADNTKVVVATSDCLKYTMPGAGSSFSFRTGNYRIQRLADLTFFSDSFQATGALLHGIMVRIGDVPLEKVSLQMKGLKYLIEFEPVTDYKQAQAVAQELVKGVSKDGYFYRRGLNTSENTTYILRSIAYDGRLNRAVEGVTYNEFDFDKRKDVIVAFRVVSRNADSVTILWKKLAEKDAPKLIQPKE